MATRARSSISLYEPITHFRFLKENLAMLEKLERDIESYKRKSEFDSFTFW